MNFKYFNEKDEVLEIEYELQYDFVHSYGEDVDGNRGMSKDELTEVSLLAIYNEDGDDVLEDLKIEEVMDIKQEILEGGLK